MSILYRLLVVFGLLLTGQTAMGQFNPANPAEPDVPVITPVPKNYTLSLASSHPGCCSLGGGGTRLEGTRVYVTCSGIATWYSFLNWTDEEGNVISTSKDFYYTTPARDVTLTANFKYNFAPNNPSEPDQPAEPAPYYNLQLLANPPGVCSFYVDHWTTKEGELLSLRPTNVTQWYQFVNWTDEEGNVLYTDRDFNYRMPGRDVTLTANFVKNFAPSNPSEPDHIARKYNLALVSSPAGWGTFNINASTQQTEGTSVTVSATAATNRRFVDWTDPDGNIVSESASYSFVMPSADYVLTAHFEKNFNPANPGEPDHVEVENVIDPDKVFGPRIVMMGEGRVAIVCETPSAEIYYTLDGSEPSKDNPDAVLYESAFEVEDNVVVRAIAYLDGMKDSQITQRRVNTFCCEAPVIAYSPGRTVTMSCPTDGASIYYTTDYTDPDPTAGIGILYTGPFVPVGDTRFKAVAVKDGLGDSEISPFAYRTVELTAKTPVISYDESASTLTISSDEAVMLYVTTDGTEPTEDMESLANPFEMQIAGNVTVKAIAASEDLYPSSLAEWKIDSFLLSAPQISYGSGRTVTMSCATDGASIYYTTDGTDPDPVSGIGTPYSEPFVPSGDADFKAIAVKDGYNVSEITSFSYRIKDLTAKPPVFTYDEDSRDLTISSDEDVVFSISLNDDMPAEAGSSTHNNHEVIGIGSEFGVIKAIAYSADLYPSEVVEFRWYFKVETPVITFTDGVVEMRCDTKNAEIRYTLDGNDPTGESVLYTGPFPFTSNAVIKAIALKDIHFPSEVAIYEVGGVDYYITASNVNGVVWSVQEQDSKLQRTESGEYVWHGDVLGNQFKITDGDWDFVNNFGSNGDVLQLGESYTMIETPEEAGNYYNVTIDTPTLILKPRVSFNPLSLDVTVTGEPEKPLSIEIVGDKVTISSEYPDEEIRYTLDGSQPGPDSDLYEMPFVPSADCVVTACVIYKSKYPLTPASATYGVTPISSPQISYAARHISMSAEEGTTIRYTLDGSDPTEESAIYEAPFIQASEATIKARAFMEGYTPSPAASFDYIFEHFKAPTPTFFREFDRVGGYVNYPEYTVYIFTERQLMDPANGLTELWAKISGHPDWDPTTEELAMLEPYISDCIENPIPLVRNDEYFLFAVGDNHFRSDILHESITEFKVAAPEIIFANGHIEMRCGTEGAEIRYTLDGIDPTEESALYTEPFRQIKNTTIKAIAYKMGFYPSEMATCEFTNGKTEKPTFSRSGNTLSLTCATPDAQIYVASQSYLNEHPEVAAVFEKIEAADFDSIKSDLESLSDCLYSSLFDVWVNDTYHAFSYVDERIPSDIVSLNIDDLPSFYVTGDNFEWRCKLEQCKFEYVGDGKFVWEGEELGPEFKINDGYWNNGINYGSNGEYLVLGEPYMMDYSSTNDNIGLESGLIIAKPMIVFTPANRTIVVTSGSYIPTPVYGEFYITGYDFDWALALPECKFHDIGNGEYAWAGEKLTGSFKINDGTWANDKFNIGTNGSELEIGKLYRCNNSINGSSYDIKLAESIEYPYLVFNPTDMTILAISLADQQVTIFIRNGKIYMESSNPDAQIRYTLDNYNPTLKSEIYTEPFLPENDCIIRACVFYEDQFQCKVTTFVYNKQLVQTATPTFTRNSDTLSLACASADATIYVASESQLAADEDAFAAFSKIEDGVMEGLEDTLATLDAYKYENAIVLTQNEDFRAFAVSEAQYYPSLVARYAVGNFFTAVPMFSYEEHKIQLASSTEGATIYYTLDGTEPTTESEIYAEPLFLTEDTIIKAIATASDFNDSYVATFEYKLADYTTADPEITRSGQNLLLSCSNPDARIFVASESLLDNNEMVQILVDMVNRRDFSNLDLDAVYAMVEQFAYSSPVALSKNDKYYAIAMEPSLFPSNLVEYYVADFKAATPEISFTEKKIRISTANADATIYYTLDGALPTDQSAKYSGAFLPGEDCTVTAIASIPGWQLSDAGTYVFVKTDHTVPQFVLTPDYAGGKVSISYDGEIMEGESVSIMYDDVSVSENRPAEFAIDHTGTVKATWESTDRLENTPLIFEAVRADAPTFEYDGRTVKITTHGNISWCEKYDHESETEESEIFVEANGEHHSFDARYTGTLSAAVWREGEFLSGSAELPLNYHHDGDCVVTMREAGHLRDAFAWNPQLPAEMESLRIQGPCSQNGNVTAVVELNIEDLNYLKSMTGLTSLDIKFTNPVEPIAEGILPVSLVEISLPVTGEIKSISLAGLKNLCAVRWNTTRFYMSEDTYNSVENPNCLFYAPYFSRIPASGNINVVVNEEAYLLRLVEGYPFHNPGDFHSARRAEFVKAFDKITPIRDVGGWETIVVPFDVSEIRHPEKSIAPFGSTAPADANKKRFWLMQPSGNGWKNSPAIMANQPYIIAMPNSPEYVNEYNLGGEITFIGENVAISEISPESIPFTDVSGNQRNFAGTYMPLEADPSVFALEGGKAFAAGNVAVAPFECFFDGFAGAERIAIAPEASALRNVEIEYADDPVYNIQGVYVGKRSEIDTFEKGIYICNGKKLIVR